MPVEAQRRRVVSELTLGGLEDNMREVLHGFARMQLATGCQHRRDVDARGVSLQHAVGEEQDSVAWLEWQRLYAVLMAADDPERRLEEEIQLVNAPAA